MKSLKQGPIFRSITTVRGEARDNVVYSKELSRPYAHMGLAFPTVKVVEKEDRLQYLVDEPIVTPEELDREREAREALYFRLRIEDSVDEEDVARGVLQYLKEKLGDQAYPRVGYYSYRDIARFDVITPFIDDDGIEDITYSGSGRRVWVFMREFAAWIPTNVELTEDYAKYIVKRLALKAGKSIDSASPVFDVVMTDGTKGLHVIFGRGYTTRIHLLLKEAIFKVSEPRGS